MKSLLIATATIFLGSLSASAENIRATAERFLAAVQTGDLKVVEQMVAEDIYFEDPTFSDAGPVKGKEAVMNVYRNYTGGIRNIHSMIMDGFTSGNTAVLTYMFYTEANLAEPDKPQHFAPIMARLTRIVEVKGGKVTRHTDLANYDAMWSAIAEYRGTAFQISSQHLKLAEDYMDALDSNKIDFAEQYVGDDIIFEDPTWGEVYHTGRAAVLNEYRTNYSGGLSNMKKRMTNSFESNGTVILSFILYGDLGVPKEDGTVQIVPVMGKVVRVFKFEEGKVVRHIDLADYDVMKQAVAKVMAAS